MAYHLYSGHVTAVQAIPIQQKTQKRDQLLESKLTEPGTTKSSGLMGSHKLNIFTVWSLSAVPMAILAISFVVVVDRTKPASPSGSFYSDGQQANLSLGSAFYSDTPSTRLTFIASFSSTLATTMLPAIMALFSYTTALAVSRESDSEAQHRLPSPYQLDLLINILGGSLQALWSFVMYVFGSKRKRVAVVPQLWKATLLFSMMAMLS
ncbi:MAG: hypothetical protein LQ339_000767 [Xanthoria mediterranea]|nr:MAG: hypothetical protein LQ339_000767 [Xanthoria mediterranea]